MMRLFKEKSMTRVAMNNVGLTESAQTDVSLNAVMDGSEIDRKDNIAGAKWGLATSGNPAVPASEKKTGTNGGGCFITGL